MSNGNKNELRHLPKGKKKWPFGKWFLLKLLRLNNFTFSNDHNKDLALTTVSNNNDYSPMLSSERNPEVSDTTGDDSSNAAWSIKIFLN